MVVHCNSMAIDFVQRDKSMVCLVDAAIVGPDRVSRPGSARCFLFASLEKVRYGVPRPCVNDHKDPNG